MLESGQIIGNYRIVRRLGEGGMGTVYEAVHAVIGRRAAIKELASELAEHPRFVRRLLDEARAVNRIGHPGVVEIFETGTTPSGAPFLVMELLEGDALDVRRRR